MADVNDLTEKIIGCAYAVSNTLGAGFLEKVYENAMVVELKSIGLECGLILNFGKPKVEIKRVVLNGAN
jgi:hypothetical protein